MIHCKCCRVTGRVQGVSYRYATRQKALGLGVCGYARNLGDGSVEVLACGDAQAVDSLCQWLLTGPAHARVSSVQCEDHELIAGSDFTIG